MHVSTITVLTGHRWRSGTRGHGALDTGYNKLRSYQNHPLRPKKRRAAVVETGIFRWFATARLVSRLTGGYGVPRGDEGVKI